MADGCASTAAGNAGGRVSPGSSSLADAPHLVAAFRQGLKEAGYVEGQNVAIVSRSAEDHLDRLPALVAELILGPVVVIVANAIAARVAKAATTIIPIVFASGGDPVKDGLVASLNRPGSNLTGVVFFSETLGTKRLELLRQLMPKAMTIPGFVQPAQDAAADVTRHADAVRPDFGDQCGDDLVRARHPRIADDLRAGDQPLHLARQTKRTPPGGDWRGCKS